MVSASQTLVFVPRYLRIALSSLAFGVKNAAKHLGSFFDGVEQRTNDAQVHEQTTWYKTRLRNVEMLAHSVEWRGGEVQSGAREILRDCQMSCLIDLENAKNKLLARLNAVRRRTASSGTAQDGPTNLTRTCPSSTLASRSPQSTHPPHATVPQKNARAKSVNAHTVQPHRYARAYQSCDGYTCSPAATRPQQSGFKQGTEGALSVLVELLDIACAAAKLSSGQA